MATLHGPIQQRRDTAANWTLNNTTLLAGEFGVETDTQKVKLGDGSTPWATLPYFVADGAPGTPGVGVPVGGTANQVLAKIDATDYNTQWVNQSGGGATNLSTTRDATSVTVASDTGTDATLAAATSLLAGVQTAADKAKLDAIEAGATANATNAQLRDRATHTGTQAASTISDFNTAADARVSAGIATHVGAADPHPQYLTSAEGNAAYAPIAHVGAGGAAHSNAVAAGAAGFMTGADKIKLDGIAAGATVNATDAALRDRATHTGTQLASTISDFNAATISLIVALS